MYFAAVTVVVFAAINTANNLLYMVLSALLAAVWIREGEREAPARRSQR